MRKMRKRSMRRIKKITEYISIGLVCLGKQQQRIEESRRVERERERRREGTRTLT